MWWEPQPGEEQLRAETFALLNRYVNTIGLVEPEPSVVRGVGIGAPVLSEEAVGPPLLRDWRPLLLIDDRSVLLSLTLPPVAPVRLSLNELDPSSRAYQELLEWPLPDDVLLEPVGPILPAVQPGAAVRGAGQATAGLPVMVNDPTIPHHHGFLTVAHGVGALGSTIYVDLQAGGQATGKVLYRDESARGTNGGDDIALVGLDQPWRLRGVLANQGVQQAPPGPRYPTLPVDLYGSVSGKVLAQVNGALLQLGDQTWQWLHCWELGATQPFMQRGDSGSVAIDPSGSGSIFGHFVGGAPALRGAGPFTHHWVQDLGRVLGRQPGLAGMITF
jgi:hypothetical protein